MLFSLSMYMIFKIITVRLLLAVIIICWIDFVFSIRFDYSPEWSKQTHKGAVVDVDVWNFFFVSLMFHSGFCTCSWYWHAYKFTISYLWGYNRNKWLDTNGRFHISSRTIFSWSFTRRYLKKKSYVLSSDQIIVIVDVCVLLNKS